ncbi:hypothetical protein Q8F55_000945 [Vanrija albida]|uniref:DNA replication factor Cdt1 C-terminal domain-containing protein n=1 Tax=Vanrija albida TaxID=181172 RepID=A0ABR3QEQ4_9TREE
MSGVNVTPMKRNAPAAPLTPETGRKRKAHASSPPLSPLTPLPPSPLAYRSRKGDDLVLAESPARTPKAPPTPIPPHLQALLSLHHGFNVALSLHIATHPPILPPHSSTTTQLQLLNLTNYAAIKDTVERTSGRRFGTQELARLAWLWAWDGESLPAESSSKMSDNPFIDAAPVTQVAGLSYLITPTRTIDPQTGRRIQSHGIGIELELQPGETRQLLMNGAEGGLGNKGQGGGVRVIGRWNAGGELREEAVRKRLERWVELHGGYTPTEEQNDQLATPTTRDSGRSTIPPIPLLPLPKLAPAVSAGNLFNLASSAPDSAPGLTTLPRSTAGLSDPFEMKPAPKKPAAKGSLDERRQAMLERIKARSSNNKGPTLAAAIKSGAAVIHHRTPAEKQEELKRRSTLSRLEGVAEGVWMMFSGPPPGPSSITSTPRSRRKAILMSEMSEMIVKSSKTPISEAEAQTSLLMLCDLCPFFLISKTVAKREWLEMPMQVAPYVSASPSADPVAALLASPTGSPRSLVGPASPGRVRKSGGLREVRERIRRELGQW